MQKKSITSCGLRTGMEPEIIHEGARSQINMSNLNEDGKNAGSYPTHVCYIIIDMLTSKR